MKKNKTTTTEKLAVELPSPCQIPELCLEGNDYNPFGSCDDITEKDLAILLKEEESKLQAKKKLEASGAHNASSTYGEGQKGEITNNAEEEFHGTERHERKLNTQFTSRQHLEEKNLHQITIRKKICRKIIKNPFFKNRFNFTSDLPPPPSSPPPQFFPPVPEYDESGKLICPKKRKCIKKKDVSHLRNIPRESSGKKKFSSYFRNRKSGNKESDSQQKLSEGEDEKNSKRKDRKHGKREGVDGLNYGDSDSRDSDDDTEEKKDSEWDEEKRKKRKGVGIERDGDHESSSGGDDGNDDDDDDVDGRGNKKGEGNDRKRKKKGRKGKGSEKDDLELKKKCKRKDRPLCRKKESELSISLLPPQIPPLQRDLPLTSPKDIPEVERQIQMACKQNEKKCKKRNLNCKTK